jgi:hypothetical protein
MAVVQKWDLRVSPFGFFQKSSHQDNSQPNHNMTSTNSGGRPANTNATRSWAKVASRQIRPFRPLDPPPSDSMTNGHHLFPNTPRTLTM